MFFRSVLIPGWMVAWASLSPAQLEVHPPQPITHHVEIQPIRVRNEAGNQATTLGDPDSETYIKEQIDHAWAQLGVKITWLPFVDYTNDFAYDGYPGTYTDTTRPGGHLSTIVNNAPTPPKSPNAIQVNMFFVKIVPGFSQTTANTSNGLAFIDANGITMHVGENLLGWQGGWDVIAGVIAHEIGHNLGLQHTVSGGDNLMSPAGTAEYLTDAQKDIIFTNSTGTDGYDFLQPYSSGSNYSQWASTHNLTGGPEDDDDNDGISNVIEFMLGSHPKHPSSLPQPAWNPNGLTWTLPKNQAALDDGLVYSVEAGSSLLNWLPAGAPGSGSTLIQNDASSIMVRLDSGAARGFMRMNVEVPPALAPAAASFVAPGKAPGPQVVSDCCHGGCGIRTAFQ